MRKLFYSGSECRSWLVVVIRRASTQAKKRHHQQEADKTKKYVVSHTFSIKLVGNSIFALYLLAALSTPDGSGLLMMALLYCVSELEKQKFMRGAT